MRRATLVANAGYMLACAAIGALPALYLLITQALLLPAILAVLGLGAGSAALALARRGQADASAIVQVCGLAVAGAILTTVDPGFVDFGLAIALLAPIYAALIGKATSKGMSWLLVAGVVAVAALAAGGLVVWPEPFSPLYGLMAGIGFVLAGLLVAHAANRLNSLFEVYDRAQLNAFRHLVEHVQDAVVRFGIDGTVLFTSHSVERLLGCRRFEVTAASLVDRVHILDRPAYMTAFSDASMGGKARRLEVRMRRDDPALQVPDFRWVEVAFSPVVDQDTADARTEVVALFRDVTDRKQQELDLREAHKAAAAASEAKSRFLATIGHELRTPLNAIVGFSEMMTTGVVGELAPTHREYAELIHKSGLHLIDVVRMLLDMSKIEAGRFELQTERLEPQALVSPCLQMIEPMARERSVSVETDIARNLPEIVADERASRQIVINLLSNAVKFSHSGGRVTLSLKRQGRFLVLAVSDSGIGMSREALTRVGEPFFQAQEGLSRTYEGTGLGLSIVKGLVELHQGEMHLASTPGEGTTVTVLLPLNGPVVKSVETGTVTQIRPGPNGTTQEEEVYDGNRTVAAAAAGR